MIGDIPQEVAIYMLHKNIEKDQLDKAIEGTNDCINIIIATDIVESIIPKFSINYIIDLARTRRMLYNPDTGYKELAYDWIAAEALENRARLTSRIGKCLVQL